MHFDWRVVLGIFMAGLMLVPLWMLVSEWLAIRKVPGGLKAWSTDLPSVNWRSAWGNHLSIVVVVAFTVAILAHAVYGAALVGELQVEAVYAIFFYLGIVQGLNVTAFIGKRATANPEMVAATAAASQGPDVMPLVSTTTTESSTAASGSSKDSSSTTTVTPVTPADSFAPPPKPPARPLPRTAPPKLKADD